MGLLYLFTVAVVPQRQSGHLLFRPRKREILLEYFSGCESKHCRLDVERCGARLHLRC